MAITTEAEWLEYFGASSTYPSNIERLESIAISLFNSTYPYSIQYENIEDEGVQQKYRNALMEQVNYFMSNSALLDGYADVGSSYSAGAYSQSIGSGKNVEATSQTMRVNANAHNILKVSGLVDLSC